MKLASITRLRIPEHPFPCIRIASSGLLLSLEVFKFKKHLRTGMAPGTFRWGADSSEGGPKYLFQGTITAKNLRKIVSYLPTGGKHVPIGGYSLLAFPWCYPCLRNI